LITGVPNQYERMMRGRLVEWTADVWTEVYNFWKAELGKANRNDKFCFGRFRNQAHNKEGYAISDCRVERHKRGLEFLIPILYPERPTRVTITMANTIFGALENRPTHWGIVIAEVVGKLADHIGRNKNSVITPYLFHLYHHHDLLNVQELVQYDTGIHLFRYDLTGEIKKDFEDEGEEEEAPKLVDSRDKR